ncbi:hypothetical protein [Pedobacter sp. AJM]|uniref:hypothetical protein n=1 Tax=Pedobacter sp. AJM TaxID=2003629 RepID=UPI000B4AD98D|nr:hypothetical protein [Pedobacter sp. AJM]OWK69073.1 hypothetical protein CBW18_18545 [Pedobacter sp. AJM]
MNRIFRTVHVCTALKYYGQAIVFLLLFLGSGAQAQSPEDGQTPGVKIDLKITDQASNTTHYYKLLGSSYSVRKPFALQKEGKFANDGNCTLILELAQNADEFLLKWVAGTVKGVKGEISIVAVKAADKPRIITFTDWEVASASESFYSTNEAIWWPHLSVYVKTLSVDGVPVFTGAANAKR